MDVQRRAHDARPAARSLEEALVVLSHELRQPLSAIEAMIEMQKRALSAERRQRAGEVIEQQVRHIGRLVATMSDVALIGRGMTLCLEPLDARTPLREALDISARCFESRRHALTVSPATEAVPVLADRTRLTQIFSNLLHNAALYTPERGRISATMTAVDGCMHCTIVDNGVGIPPEWLDRIFTLFERGPNRTAVAGTGVGLGLVRALVELHGGTVAAKSEGQGRGSAFTVTLPLHVAGPGCAGTIRR